MADLGYTGTSSALDKENNIPELGDYCVTNVKHHNGGNHCSSSFLLWELKSRLINYRLVTVWEEQEWVDPLELLELLQKKSVYSAKKHMRFIETGEKIEVEFRISHNDSSFPLSEMPPG